MKNTLLASAFIATLLSSPACATTTIVNLSATNPTYAVAQVSLLAHTNYVVSLVQATYTAFAPASPAAGNWADYFKYSTDNVNFSYYGTLSARYDTAANAFAAYSAQAPLAFNFPTATTLYFQIGDSLSSLGDDTGGTSIRVTTVPEPAAWAMMLTGFGIIGLAARQRRKASVSYS